MPDAYRITVRGIMSERFCRGFPGLVSSPGPGRTVLEGDLPCGVRVDDVLSKLGNLGVEVLAVEPLDAASTHPKER
jgi:hypothetical protein